MCLSAYFNISFPSISHLSSFPFLSPLDLLNWKHSPTFVSTLTFPEAKQGIHPIGVYIWTVGENCLKTMAFPFLRAFIALLLVSPDM